MTTSRSDALPDRCECGAAALPLGCLECGAACCPTCAVPLESATYCRRCAVALLGTVSVRTPGPFVLH